MSRLFLTPIDMGKLEILNQRVHVLSSAPASPVTGQIYYDSTANKLYYWNGSSWIDTSGGTGVLASTFDAKGDLIAGTADNTYSKLTVGADDTILMADAAQTTGLKWVAPTTTPAAIGTQAGGSADTFARGDHVHATGAGTPSTQAFGDAAATGSGPAAAMTDHKHAMPAHSLAIHQELIQTSDLTDWPRVASLDLNSQKITSLLDPTGAQDAATKAYVDATAAGIDWKRSVRAATTAAGTLASSFENGDAIDGVTLATGDRILIKDQAAGAENGIYTVNASGAPTRATDADTAAEVTSGMAVFVEEGTTNADTGWVMTNNGAITLGTTALVFAQFTALGQVTAGAGLTKTGATLDVGAGSGISVAADSVAIDTAVVVRKYAASFGDGAATSYNIDHNLGTLDVTLEVFRNSDGVKVECDVTHSTTNRVILAFAVAPTSNQYRVVVHG